MRHISTIDRPRTAKKIRDVAVNEGFVGDRYHILIVNGAGRMYGLNFGHFEYLGSHATSTLWRDPNSDGTLRVYEDGRLG